MVLASRHSATWTDTQGRGYLLTSTQHNTLSSAVLGQPAPGPPHLPVTLPAFSPSDLRLPEFAGRNSSLHLLYLKCPRSHLNSPRCHHKHSRHSVSALLFDKTVDTVQGQCWLHPTHSQGPGVGTHPSHQTAAVPPGLQAIRRILSPHPQVPWACTFHSSS